MFRNSYSFCCPSDHFLRHAKQKAFTQFCPGVGMVIRNQNTTGHSAHPSCYLRMFVNSTAQKKIQYSFPTGNQEQKHPHQNFRFFSPWFLSWNWGQNWDQNLSAAGKSFDTVALWFQFVEICNLWVFPINCLGISGFSVFNLGVFCIDMYWVHLVEPKLQTLHHCTGF